MDTTIAAHLEESRVRREVMVSTMLQNKDSPRSQQSAIHNEVGQLSQTFQGIGRVGKDEVVALSGASEESKNIRLDRLPGIIAQLVLYLINI